MGIKFRFAMLVTRPEVIPNLFDAVLLKERIVQEVLLAADFFLLGLIGEFIAGFFRVNFNLRFLLGGGDGIKPGFFSGVDFGQGESFIRISNGNLRLFLTVDGFGGEIG